VSQVVSELNDEEVDGHLIYTERAQKKAERHAEKFARLTKARINRYQGVNLYVNHLDDRIDGATLHQKFSQFDNITSAKVIPSAIPLLSLPGTTVLTVALMLQCCVHRRLSPSSVVCNVMYCG